MIFQNLIGQKFNKLVVKAYIGKNKSGQSVWQCICDCGSNHITTGTHLKTGNVKSCGCLKSENNAGYIHGMFNTPEYTSYHAAKKRCNIKFINKWPDYAGRGIEFRFNSFEEFYKEVGPRPEPKFKYSLERINNDGHYEKGNVKWSTKKQQARNRRCDNCNYLKQKIFELEQKIQELQTA